ncbi:MAG: molybdopterin-dependent oxidoreductase [Thermodesulfobacteriota bacterium]
MGALAEKKSENNSKIVRTTSAFDCGGRCPLRLHVREGKVVRVEGDDTAGPEEQLRACLRCRAIRRYIHHPDRLLYPQKRVGPKGKGLFQRISWDEAYETITAKLKYYIDTYGNSSIFLSTGGGYLGSLHSGGAAFSRLLNLLGGYSGSYGNVSSEGAVWACQTHYGSVMVGHSREDMQNSKLILLWGWDPARMISGTNTMYHLIRARENGARVVTIDPRYTDTAVAAADEWIPIRPGTDTAMMIAMAYVIIRENLQDQAFLDKYTIGFAHFKDYVLGKEDGLPKTPAWAEAITDVPASTIERLAREYALTKPACLMDCQGPARSAIGEQYNRCAMTLTNMTGNTGRPGGSAAGGLMGIPVGHMFFGSRIPSGKNPVEAGGPSIRGTLDLKLRLVRRVHTNVMHDAMLKGKAGGYPFDIKFVFNIGSNHLNQLGNANKAARAYEQVEFMVVNEMFMTPTARYADILLPVTSPAERMDTTRPWPSGPYYTFMNQAIEPMGECKSDLDIAADLAARMGLKDFRPLSDDEYLRTFIEKNPETGKEIPNYEQFKAQGVHRVKLKEPIVAFREQIEDPENHPFPTPSGKIEIYSQRVADIGDPENLPPIPKYRRVKEDRFDPLIEKYPLQMLSPHPRTRTHSTMFKVEWLQEVEPHRAWINPTDAEARGIKDGDEILVFNDRGTIAIKAWITNRIISGVISVTEGAWYDPDEQGIDRGGCPNTLTLDEYSPGGAAVLKTVLVEVKKA